MIKAHPQHEKHQPKDMHHLFIISIVAVVAIVGMVFLFISIGNTNKISINSEGDLAGGAFEIHETPEIPEIPEEGGEEASREGEITYDLWSFKGNAWGGAIYPINTLYYVGIGTSNPGAKLDVVSSSGWTIRGKTVTGTAILGYSTSSGAGVYGNSVSGGGVIGSSNSGNGVAGQSTTSSGVYGGSDSYHGVHGYSKYDFGIYCYGTKCGGNQQWTVSSDERLKKNINTVTDALDKVRQLRGVTFEWKNEDFKGTNLGFIAQEVLPVVPEVVGIDSEGYYTIKDSALTALLVEAVKEQDEKITQLTKIVCEDHPTSNLCR